MGLFFGFIFLSGGYGMAIVWFLVFYDNYGICNVLEIVIVCVIFGLVFGGIVGGFIVKFLIICNKLELDCDIKDLIIGIW